MALVKALLCSFVLFHGFVNDNAVQAQGSSLAKVNTPVVQSTQGKEARLSCAVSLDDQSEDSSSSKIRFCVWERLQQQQRSRNNDHAFIINFNDINSQPGLYSGVAGYSYSGEGFPSGECGVKISFVKTEDIAKWQCTLITDEKIFRGYVDLVRKPEPQIAKNSSTPVKAVASSRTAIDNNNEQNSGLERARPIITSYNDARSIIQPEIIVHTTSSNGSPQLIQEVKVESAGLEIKPRRGGKLIVFE